MKAKIITDKKDLEEAFNIRKEVFVEEQKVPLEDEFDEHDSKAEHILVFYNDKPAATGRLRIIEGVAKLERICVLKNYRKAGLGKVVVETLEKTANAKGVKIFKLHGQTHAENFYKKLGYQKASDVFMEDGIPHFLMVKNF